MERYEIINRIIKSKDYKKYLEIGVRDGECFKKINCKYKIGVDPNPTSDDTTHITTSDEYFTSFIENKYICDENGLQFTFREKRSPRLENITQYPYEDFFNKNKNLL
jgi:hypothetical protein